MTAATNKPTPVHPLALRVLQWSRRARWVFLALSMVILFVVALLVFCCPKQFTLIDLVVASFMYALVAILTAYLVTFITLILFFVRYTLRQLMAVTLATASLVSGAVLLDGGLMAIPILGLLIWGAFLLLDIRRQDPTGEGSAPNFIQRHKVQQVLEKIRNRRKLAQARDTRPTPKQDLTPESIEGETPCP